MSKRLRKKLALKGIDSAFKGVTLEDGVSLHETLEIDNHRKVIPESKARMLDEVHDWKALLNSPHMYEFCFYGGINFFDGKGFRFHLPAYLVACIRYHKFDDLIISSMISNITKPAQYRISDFMLFSNAQRAAILNAVLYLHEFDIVPLENDELAGLHQYWA